MKDQNAAALSLYCKGDMQSVSGNPDKTLREHWDHNDLDALGVVGLRQTDLRDINIACCGDCRHSGSLTITDATTTDATTDFTCARQYTTSLYSVRALRCPHFELRPSLPDEPQTDERANFDRRQATLPVIRERRSGSERRRLSVIPS